MQKIEIEGTLDYINNTVNSAYNRLYDAAKDMNKDQLLELFGTFLDEQVKKENAIIKDICDSKNMSLAINYAHITQSYVKRIDSSVDDIISKNNQNTQNVNDDSSLALPGNVIK